MSLRAKNRWQTGPEYCVQTMESVASPPHVPITDERGTVGPAGPAFCVAGGGRDGAAADGAAAGDLYWADLPWPHGASTLTRLPP